ncbi:glycosyltransferase family 4 protein [Candidatus Falkowbacteria bacterium]|nr:glycosyltransferase family 4 protein [Candidatus Falkowbacteria bacterium]
MEKRKRKVVILSAFYEPFMSGAEQMVKEIAERLGKKYDITLIAARLDRRLPKQERRENFNLVRLGVGHKKIDKPFYPLLAALKLRSLKPEIAHAIMESYAGGALVLTKYIYPHAKRILTLQSGDLDDPLKQSKFFIKFFWRCIHLAPHIITAISNFLGARAARLGANKEKIFIIPNGVDLSQIPASKEKVANRVICVARLSWEKGLDYLIKAWPEVLKEVSEAKLVLVGEGNKRQEIEAMIRDLNIADFVVLKGNLPHNETLKEIKKSEVFICPSLAEGLGIVFIEAQACGVPPIGTRVGGIPDIIQDGENGFLIEPKNSRAIAEAIIKLLKDKNLAGKLSANALQTVKKYDWKNIINKIDGIYEKIIS